MAILYSISNRKDNLLLSELGGESFNYSLYKTNCGETTLINQGVIGIGATVNFLITIDGQYSLVLTQESEEDITIPLVLYKNLINNFIANFNSEICNCSCVGCDGDCVSNCTSLSKLLAKGNLIYFLNSAEYNAIFNIVAKELLCLVDNSQSCISLEEFLHGDWSETNTFEILASAFYLTFYFTEYSYSNDNQEDIDYVDAKYKAKEISACLKKKGIDMRSLKEILDLLPSLEGFYGDAYNDVYD